MSSSLNSLTTLCGIPPLENGRPLGNFPRTSLLLTSSVELSIGVDLMVVTVEVVPAFFLEWLNSLSSNSSLFCSPELGVVITSVSLGVCSVSTLFSSGDLSAEPQN